MTNEFRKLPLITVQCRIALVGSPIPTTIPFAIDLLEEWSGEVAEIKGIDEIDGIEIAPASQPSLKFRTVRPFQLKLSNGITVRIQDDMISAIWQKEGGAEYPRFSTGIIPAVKECLRTCESLIGAELESRVVQMTYVNRLDSDRALENAESYLKAGLISSNFGDDRLMNFREVRRIGSVDMRVELEYVDVETKENEFLTYNLVTAAGMINSGNLKPIEALQITHDAMNIRFEQLISEEAKTEWQLIRNNT